MVKQTQVHKSTKKPLLVAGMLLSLAIIGVGGCGSTTPTSAPVAAGTQPSTPTPTASGANQKTAQNPAQKAAMEISRLQRDPQSALTSDQKSKIKPILQELISTPNPSPAILQQQADAINAVLTAQQKSFLAAPRTSNGTKQNTNNPNGNSPNGNSPQTGVAGKPTGSAPKPQDMYQRVLDSLK